ncbi:uncharacterized protein LOC135811688 [Sycon ciliatum]|uniref:uncharacterized protein LOC135811688 n=1 Tax=Sycon ciliatum TaxID=27933 RepID=UPI0031F6004D
MEADCDGRLYITVMTGVSTVVSVGLVVGCLFNLRRLYIQIRTLRGKHEHMFVGTEFSLQWIFSINVSNPGGQGHKKMTKRESKSEGKSDSFENVHATADSSGSFVKHNPHLRSSSVRMRTEISSTTCPNLTAGDDDMHVQEPSSVKGPLPEYLTMDEPSSTGEDRTQIDQGKTTACETIAESVEDESPGSSVTDQGTAKSFLKRNERKSNKTANVGADQSRYTWVESPRQSEYMHPERGPEESSNETSRSVYTRPEPQIRCEYTQPGTDHGKSNKSTSVYEDIECSGDEPQQAVSDPDPRAKMATFKTKSSSSVQSTYESIGPHSSSEYEHPTNRTGRTNTGTSTYEIIKPNNQESPYAVGNPAQDVITQARSANRRSGGDSTHLYGTSLIGSEVNTSEYMLLEGVSRAPNNTSAGEYETATPGKSVSVYESSAC